jgi:hypothetical protein
MAGSGSFGSCEAAWSGGQAEPHGRRMACLGSRKRPHQACRQTSLLPAATRAATAWQRGCALSTSDRPRRYPGSGETSREAAASAVFWPTGRLARGHSRGRTLRGPCGGLHEEAIPPVPRRLPRRRWRQRALGPQGKRHPRLVQPRRARRPGCMGLRARHRPLRPEPIKGGRRLVSREDTRSLLCPGGPCPCGTTARVPPSRARGAPWGIRVLPGCWGQVREDG